MQPNKTLEIPEYSSPLPTRRPWLGRMILLLGLLALAELAWLDLIPESQAYRYAGRWMHPQSDPLVANLQQIDQRMSQLADGGNVFLHFTNLDKQNAGVLPAQLYFRSIYCLYPNRSLIGDPSLVVSDFQDITQMRFHPDARWLREHNVRTVADITITPGGVSYQISPHKIDQTSTSP